MSQNNQTHFKNIAANDARFLKCVLYDHFMALFIKGLKHVIKVNSSIRWIKHAILLLWVGLSIYKIPPIYESYFIWYYPKNYKN